MEGFFKLTIESAIEMIQRGTLVYDDSCEEAKEAWMKNSEPTYQFIIENMKRTNRDNEFTAVLKKDLLRQIQSWYDETFSDNKSRPNDVNDLTNAIKLVGGQLDERKTFLTKLWDKDSNPIYDGKDANGRPIQAEGSREMHCYILPWKWNPENKYAERVKKCVKTIEDSNIGHY